MNAHDDLDLLLNEAKRICNSLDGKIRADQLRMQFIHARIRDNPKATSANQAFARAVERAKSEHLLADADDGLNYQLREQPRLGEV